MKARAAALGVILAMVASLAAVATVAAGPPAGAELQTHVERDVQYGVADGQPLLLDAWVPPADGSYRRPAVVLIHGGDFHSGDKSTFDPEAKLLSDQGWVVFNVNYRINEPTAFPAEFDDVQTAVRWVRASADRYLVNPAKVGALGESAGGTLALLLATTGSGPLTTGTRVRTAASWSGYTDFVTMANANGPAWTQPLFGCTVTECLAAYQAASPVLQLDHSDAPVVVINSRDEQVPVDQVQEISDRLLHDNVVNSITVYRGTRHALDYRSDAIGTTVSFFNAYFARSHKSGGETIAFGITLVVMVFGAWIVIRRQGATADPLRKK